MGDMVRGTEVPMVIEVGRMNRPASGNWGQ